MNCHGGKQDIELQILKGKLIDIKIFVLFYFIISDS